MRVRGEVWCANTGPGDSRAGDLQEGGGGRIGRVERLEFDIPNMHASSLRPAAELRCAGK
jgi:hypothetical protein